MKINRILDQKNELLEEKNRELRKLSIATSKTSNAVTIFDENGKIEWFNKAANTLYGCTIEEFIKNKSDFILDASSNEEIHDHFTYCKETLKSSIYETRILSKNELKHIQTTLTPITNDENIIEHFVAIDTDITEIKNAEEEIIMKNEEILAQKDELEAHRNHLEKLVIERTKDLKVAKEKAEESDRLKSSFLANMSHEIRTPMNAIIGISEFLDDPDLSKETKKELSQLIHHNSNTLLRLIDDIIDIAKIEAGQLSIHKQNCNVTNIIKNLKTVLKEKQLAYKKEHIQIIISDNIKNINGDLIIDSDPIRLEQILSNLLENALKFTEKGSIEIDLNLNDQVKQSSITFFVKDSGIGISKEQQVKIFDRFTKLEDDKRKLYRGAGLGLAICKNLISLLDGEIWLESELGKGTTFYFTLPLTKFSFSSD